MKNQTTFTTAILATLVMSVSFAHAEEKAAPAAATPKAPASKPTLSGTPAQISSAQMNENKEFQRKAREIVERVEKKQTSNPYDVAFAKWFKEKESAKTSWTNVKAHKLLERQLKIHAYDLEHPKKVAHAPRPPKMLPAVIVAPTPAAPPPEVVGQEEAPVAAPPEDDPRVQEALARLAASEAAFKKCTEDCAAVKSQVAGLIDQNKQLQDRLAASQEEARRAAEGNRRVSPRDRRNLDDRDSDLDDTRVGGRRRSSPSSTRLAGRNGNEVLNNLFGRGNNGVYGNDPFSLNNNPNLFGANGMQNPYNNWMNQMRMQQAYNQSQQMYNPYGLMNNGRQLPNMYPAPGGGYQQYPQYAQQYPQYAAQYPQYAQYPQQFNRQAPMYAPYMGQQQPWNTGYAYGGLNSSPIYAGGAYGRTNAPAILPITGGAQYGLNAQVGNWSSYNQYQYAQYNTRQLPTVYPAPR